MAGGRPANATAGATLAPAVQVSLLDAAGNLCTRSTNAVTVTLGTNPTGGMLSGTRTAAAVNGTATFSGLSIARAGEGYTLAASATGLAGATSQSFKVTAGPVAKMAFTVQPGSTMARTAISPAVAVALQDALGNTVPLATDVITTTIATNPASGTLSGTTRKTTAGGVATFANLMIDKPGTGYRLKATSAAGLPAVTSEPFDVGP